MRKITTMPTLNAKSANAITRAVTKTGAQRAGIMLALTFLLMLAPSAGAQFTPLYNFGTHAGDPAHPNYPGFVVQGRDGNLYSTSYNGGTDNAGTVFKVTPAGQVTVLYSFEGVTGAFPSGGLTLGSDGNFMAPRLKTAHRITGLSSKSLPAGNSQSCTRSTAPTARAPGEHRSRAQMAVTTELLNTGDRRNAAPSTGLLPGNVQDSL